MSPYIPLTLVVALFPLAGSLEQNPLERLRQTPASRLDLGLHRLTHWLERHIEEDEEVGLALVYTEDDQIVILLSRAGWLETRTEAVDFCRDKLDILRFAAGVDPRTGRVSSSAPHRGASSFARIIAQTTDRDAPTEDEFLPAIDEHLVLHVIVNVDETGESGTCTVPLLSRLTHDEFVVRWSRFRQFPPA